MTAISESQFNIFPPKQYSSSDGAGLLTLPCSLLECLMELVDSDGAWPSSSPGPSPSSMRRCCRLLRDALDSVTPHLALGGRKLTCDDQGATITGAPPCGWLPLLQRLPRLTSLLIQPWVQLCWSDALHAAGTGLLQLTMRSRPEVLDLTPLAAACPRLQQLDLSGCSGLTSLAPLAACRALQQLDVRGLDLANWSSLGPLTTLQHLTFSGCPHIRDLRALTPLLHLRHLDVSSCLHLESFQGLAACTQLQHLNASCCHHVADLTPLAACSALTLLDLWQCSAVSQLQPLSSCSRLTCLIISGCCQVADLSPLQGSAWLEHLRLNELSNITTLQPLTQLHALRYLELSCSWGITSLEPLAQCKRLRHLDISRCRPLNTEPLAALSTLCIVR